MKEVEIPRVVVDRESKEGRMADALALGGEEGRDKLRKSTGIGTYE